MFVCNHITPLSIPAQGLDSWFVPAFSAIADSTVLLNHVIPPDQGFSKHENYCGIFHFRFWFGRWIEIVIDDLLPTRKGLLVYMKSTSNVEYWPALLEKAYAKAKGTYELLNSWLPIDACIELTGGCPERVKFFFLKYFWYEQTFFNR